MKGMYLSEREGVDLVLGGKLKTDGGALLGIPGSLGTGLDGGVDLLVVRGSEDIQRVGGGDGSVVERGGVTDGSGVLGDGSLLHIVSNLTTDDEALVAEDGIGDSADGTGGVEVAEDAAVEVGLFEVEVDLLALVAGGRVEVGEDLGLQAASEGVVELDLGGQQVRRVPRLGDADACAPARQRYEHSALSIISGGLRDMEHIRSETIRDMNGD
jgi:hypothetical protein